MQNDTITRTQEQLKEDFFFSEARRLIDLARRGSEDILREALDGRERSVENVQKLWRAVARTFSASMSLPPGRGRADWQPYWSACSEFLRTAGWSDEQLQNLRYPLYRGPGLL